MKALIVASIANFISGFELNDITILRQMGYEVHCATNYTDSRKERMEKLVALGVVNHQIDFCRNPLDKNNILAYKQLKNILKAEHFDLIHCHTPIGGVLTRIAARKYRKNNTKVIYTAHGFHFYDGAPKRNWLIYYPIELFLSHFTDIIITINKEDYKRAKRKLHAKTTVYIPGVGLDTCRFNNCFVDVKEKRKSLGLTEREFVLLSVGELQDRKNQIVVIEAINLLKKESNFGNLVYLIVGEGENRSHYSQLISDYGLDYHIRLLGYRTDIDELCKISDCFIHPSIREGLGIAPLEAMASGLPLLCSNANGIKDYAENGKTGVVFDPENVQQVKDAIMKVYEDQHFREKCGNYNVEKAREFDIKNTDAIMKEVYRSVGGGMNI